MTIGERKQFEREQIGLAWRAMWPRTPWLRDAEIVWGENLSWMRDGEGWEEFCASFVADQHVVYNFHILFPTVRLTNQQYAKIVSWGEAIGFPMWAPVLSDPSECPWKDGASFEASLAPYRGEEARNHLWEHGRAMDSEPALRPEQITTSRKASKALVGTTIVSMKVGLMAMGVDAAKLE